jgi:hypothetical protein
LGFEIETECYREKVNKKFKKKWRKKYKKLWNNTISLQEYNRRIEIDKNYVIQRREARYKHE